MRVGRRFSYMLVVWGDDYYEDCISFHTVTLDHIKQKNFTAERKEK